MKFGKQNYLDDLKNNVRNIKYILIQMCKKVLTSKSSIITICFKFVTTFCADSYIDRQAYSHEMSYYNISVL